ncbi:YajG family lipoprotein [Psychrosphaera sp. B3R10]|uniref:YajG family lipoprotein n=1 Tax=unclassified Psychrosphaera TaxID=2641570 RepID=UPI001C0860B6|nr:MULTISPECIES: YajG family lipoprotein [unclassified Psychrosphaera]MBU2882558.1 YajG family lipoprotein [Psychrosphaera sp. I2R16]MBU2989424.1 YajG family lipoprotein [Psychrosphaera sp. B3R10]MDO6718258.1 YajG family lipoprotein [Psychrosphaera sp. 1_MG-2023]
MSVLSTVIRVTLTSVVIGFLSACITPTSQPMLIFPDTIINKPMMSVKSATVVDSRSNKTLAVINKVDTPPNPNLESQLTTWLNDSVTVNPRGRLDFTVEILNYATYVMQGTMQFEAESVMEWQAKITGENGFSWIKNYQTTIKQDGPLNMDKSEIEIHLNKMANTLLSRTLEDPEFNAALSH